MSTHEGHPRQPAVDEFLQGSPLERQADSPRPVAWPHPAPSRDAAQPADQKPVHVHPADLAGSIEEAYALINKRRYGHHFAGRTPEEKVFGVYSLEGQFLKHFDDDLRQAWAERNADDLGADALLVALAAFREGNPRVADVPLRLSRFHDELLLPRFYRQRERLLGTSRDYPLQPIYGFDYGAYRLTRSTIAAVWSVFDLAPAYEVRAEFIPAYEGKQLLPIEPLITSAAQRRSQSRGV